MKEENKLIAEFMGMESFKDMLSTLNNGKINISIDIYEQAKYHSSWDWLMPVVEKIEQTNDGCTLVIIEDERCYIDNQKGFEIDSVGHTKIEAVYNAVIKFIKNK